MEFSAKAKLNWELKNNIVATLNPDPSKAIPFMDDPIYFQRVNISELSLLKMVTHSSSNPLLDLVGLLVGHPDGDSVIVTDAFALPVEPHEKVHSKLLDYYNTHLHDGVLDNVVGWYHSSKSGVTACPDDTSTQIQIQHLKPLSVALIIEPGSTINVVQVIIEAIMSFPEGFVQPPVLPLSKRVTAPKRQLPDHILAAGRHLKKRRRLVVKYFKSQVDANQVEDLWNKYWEYTLSSPISGIPRLVWNTARASEFKDLKNQVNTEVYDIYAENPGSPIKHSIKVNSRIAFERQPYGEDMEALFTQLLEEAGCSGSQISSTAITRVIATLTQDEAMKLSRNDWVNNVRPLTN